MRAFIIKACLIVAACSGSVFGQSAPTQILDTLVNPDGSHPSGYITISWSIYQNDAVPRQYIYPGSKTVPVNAGVVNTSLFPNQVAIPAGTCYSVAFFLSGNPNITRYWTVSKSSTPLLISQVQGDIQCTPSAGSLIAPGQISDGGATIGQSLVFNGTYWAPANGGGSGGSPGGINGQIQFNNLGAFGGFTIGGDCTLNRPNLTCLSTNGHAFVASSYVDTTNASNISSGTLAPARGGTGATTAFTLGSVVFAGAGGAYSQDNANFFWDGTNHRLGIGTSTPSQALDAVSQGNDLLGGIRIRSSDSSSNGGYLILNKNSVTGSYGLVQAGDTTNFDELRINPSGGNITLGASLLQVVFGTGDVLVGGTSDGNYRLDVQKSGSAGTLRVFDQTPSTGATSIIIQAGASQPASGTAPIVTLNNSSSAAVSGLLADGTVWGKGFTSIANVSSVVGASLDASYSTGLSFSTGKFISWSSTTSWFGTADTGVARGGPGLVEINNGQASQRYGTSLQAGAALFYDNTPGTGISTLAIQAGAGQNTFTLAVFENNSGVNLSQIGSDGSFAMLSSGARTALVANNQIGLGSGGILGFRSATGWDSGSLDTGLSRISAGLLGVGNGTQGDFSGSLEAANLTATASISTAALTNSGLTSGRVSYSTTGGLQTDSANLTFNGTNLTTVTLTATNTVATNYTSRLGGSFQCTHGSNATCGVSTLASGTVTVSTTAIGALAAAGGAGYAVSLTPLSCSSCGTLSIGTVVSATSFVINSTSGSDGSKVYWEIRVVN